MAQTVSLNGRTYSLPTSNDVDWGASVASWMKDLTNFVNTFQNSLSVIDFGATGDGVTDDTSAIQAAITAATPGTSIIFPVPSTYYKITAPLTVTNKTGLELKFSKSSVSAINLYNTYAGPAVKFDNSNYCRVSDASIQNTQTATGIGIWLTNLSYEIDISTCHVKNGLAGLQLGDVFGGSCFNVFVNRCKFEGTGVSTPSGASGVTLTYGVLLNAGVNLFFDYCYAHGCVTGYKRIVPNAGATPDNRRVDNVRFDHCIAEACDTFGFDLQQVYAVTLERPYIEQWGVIDATPLSAAINVSGLSITDIDADNRSVTVRVIDPLFYGEGCGGSTGQGVLVKMAKYFHFLEYRNAQSTPGRTNHLVLDDENSTDYGLRKGRPLVILEGRTYGSIVYTDSQAIVFERGVTGAIHNLDTVAVGTKSDVGTGDARGSVGETVTSSKKFADRSYAVRGNAHMVHVVDTTAQRWTLFDPSSPNNSFDDNAFFEMNFNESAGGDGYYARSKFNDGKLSTTFDTGLVKLQATKEDGTSTKKIQINPSGGVVELGGGTYDKPIRLGTVAYLWVTTGKLYINTSLPTTSTDGTIVGTQS